MSIYNKILGCLLGGAVGDAMGTPTETRSTSQIIEKYGGLVKDFIAPPDDVFARGFAAGSVSDDFSLAYCTVRAILDNKGVINDEVAKNALLGWSKTKYYALAGPTTVAVVDKMLGKDVMNFKPFLTYDTSKGSDGGAMKIAPIALFSKGNVDKAIEDAITICLPTHFNNSALAGACAIAAATAEALNDNATVDSMVEAGLKGAMIGNDYAVSRGKELANPSIYKRIVLAVEIAKKCNGDMGKAMQELADVIGSGLPAAEAVPCAFGLLVAANGDAQKAIIAGVNIGSDTDTVATMVGAMSGAYCSYYDADKLAIIDSVNGYDLRALAKEVESV